MKILSSRTPSKPPDQSRLRPKDAVDFQHTLWLTVSKFLYIGYFIIFCFLLTLNSCFIHCEIREKSTLNCISNELEQTKSRGGYWFCVASFCWCDGLLPYRTYFLGYELYQCCNRCVGPSQHRPSIILEISSAHTRDSEQKACSNRTLWAVFKLCNCFHTDTAFGRQKGTPDFLHNLCNLWWPCLVKPSLPWSTLCVLQISSIWTTMHKQWQM